MVSGVVSSATIALAATTGPGSALLCCTTDLLTVVGHAPEHKTVYWALPPALLCLGTRRVGDQGLMGRAKQGCCQTSCVPPPCHELSAHACPYTAPSVPRATVMIGKTNNPNAWRYSGRRTVLVVDIMVC